MSPKIKSQRSSGEFMKMENFGMNERGQQFVNSQSIVKNDTPLKIESEKNSNYQMRYLSRYLTECPATFSLKDLNFSLIFKLYVYSR